MDLYPPASFQFVVRFGSLWGRSDASFQEVGGIGPEMETQPYREGGENRFMHMLPTGVKQPKLSLKRGLAAYDSQLVQWCRSILEGGLAERITTRDLFVYLLDENNAPLRGWSFENAYPSHWAVDPFQAERSAVAIEKIDLNYAASTRKL